MSHISRQSAAMDPTATPISNPGDSVIAVAADAGVGDEVGAEVGFTPVVIVRNAELWRLTFDGDDAVGTVDCYKVELSVAAVMLRSKSSPWTHSYARTYPRQGYISQDRSMTGWTHSKSGRMMTRPVRGRKSVYLI